MGISPIFGQARRWPPRRDPSWPKGVAPSRRPCARPWAAASGPRHRCREPLWSKPWFLQILPLTYPLIASIVAVLSTAQSREPQEILATLLPQHPGMHLEFVEFLAWSRVTVLLRPFPGVARSSHMIYLLNMRTVFQKKDAKHVPCLGVPFQSPYPSVFPFLLIVSPLQVASCWQNAHNVSVLGYFDTTRDPSNAQPSPNRAFLSRTSKAASACSTKGSASLKSLMPRVRSAGLIAMARNHANFRGKSVGNHGFYRFYPVYPQILWLFQ